MIHSWAKNKSLSATDDIKSFLNNNERAKWVCLQRKKHNSPLQTLLRLPLKQSSSTVTTLTPPSQPVITSGISQVPGQGPTKHGEGVTKIIKNPKCVDKLKHPEKSKMCWSKPVDSSYEGIFHTPSSWKKPFQAPPSMKFPICAEFWGILGSLKENVRKKICHEIFLPRWWFLPWWWYTTLKK